MGKVTTACMCSQMQHIKHCCKADIHLSSWILRYDPERLHCLPCSNPLSGSRYLIIPACYRNNCNLFCFCSKQGCPWSSRHYLRQAKFAFTSRVQRVLFIYFIKAFAPVSKQSKSENYETCLVSHVQVSPTIGMAGHSEALFYGRNHCSENRFL